MGVNLELFSSDQTNSVRKSDRLLRVFEDIHNHIYANDGLSAQQAFEEVLKMLFIKIFDEKNNSPNQFYISVEEFELSEKGKVSPQFLKRLDLLKQKAINYFSGILKKSESKLKNTSLAYIVNRLQNIDLSNSSSDVKGLAFQKFVYSKQRSDRGQFFTPEQIVKLCVQFIAPKKEDKILDPTCGSAGFLSEAMKFVFEKYYSKSDKKTKRQYVKNNLFGVEINSLVAKIAKMRMILDGDGDFNISIVDSLSSWDIINYELNKSASSQCKYEKYFDVILTNPPFGTQGKINNKRVLQNFDLGYKWIKKENGHSITDELQNGQVPDILFIERCLDFLKVGGRMAIVLPNGDLENPSLEYVRNYIEKRAEIIAIVNLPFETFIPFGTGIKASVLFLKKLEHEGLVQNKVRNYPIFFARIEKIGYVGNKNGSIIYKRDKFGNKISDEHGNYLIDEDISELVNKFKEFVKGAKSYRDDENSFAVKSGELEKRFDFNYYKPQYRKLERDLRGKLAVELGSVVEIVKRKSSVLPRKNSSVNYVELADISSAYSEIINSTKMSVHQLPSRASYQLKEGDIITAVAGNSIGTEKHVSALVAKEFNDCICTNGLRILKPLNNLDPYYLLYYLRSQYFLKQVYRYRTGAAIPSISDEDLNRILIYLPPQQLQSAIGRKVMESYELRRNASAIINDINIDFHSKLLVSK